MSRHRSTPLLGALLLTLLLREAAAIGRYQRLAKRPLRTKQRNAFIVGYKTVQNGQIAAASYAAAQSLQILSQQGRVKGARKLNGLRSRPAFVVEAEEDITAAELHQMLQGGGSVASVMNIGPSTDAAAAEIAFIEPDYPRYLISMPTQCGSGDNGRCQDDVGYYYQFINTNTDLVWANQSFGGTGAMGGIIDTGVMHTHVDLEGITDITRSRSCISGTCSGDGADQNGHGTHCAGIMAARHDSGGHDQAPVGVMDSATIISCRFMDRTGSGYTSDAIDCIDYLITTGASVLSNSWGGGGDSLALAEAMKIACEQDVLFVVAAGNDASDTADVDGEPAYPAYYAEEPGMECVLTVGSSNKKDTLSSFSNYGPKVRIVAPGENIYSTWFYKNSPAVTNGAAFLSGTSMATPFVSGIALALRNLYPTLKAVDIKNAIINSATKAPQTLNNVTIGNIIDTQAALTAAAIAAGQNPGPTSGNSPGPSKPPTPSPSPPNPAKCTSADCATTDLPICVPAIGCVRIGDPATCSQTCQDQFDPASYDEYCYSPCTTSNPDDCTPTPTPTRTGCVTYDHWGTRYTGICDGQGMCVGECLEDADCRIKNPQKPLCMLYAGSPQDNDFQPSVCVECLEDADCPTVPAGWDSQCVDTSSGATLCSGNQCQYSVLNGNACTTSKGQTGYCNIEAQCIPGCQTDDDCASNYFRSPDGYVKGCYWYKCGAGGQCQRGPLPKEPCKTRDGKQGQCTKRGTCKQVICPNAGVPCYSTQDCCSDGNTRLLCLPNSKGLLRCTPTKRSNQFGKLL